MKKQDSCQKNFRIKLGMIIMLIIKSVLGQEFKVGKRKITVSQDVFSKN